MKILHAADIHLDSSLAGLERYEGAPEVDASRATRRAFARVVDLAVEEEVSLVILAGDVFEGEWQDYGTGIFFVTQLERLREAGIPVVIIKGNHDATNRVTRALQLPDNCYLLSDERPDSIHFDALGISVHGQSYRTARVDENLVRNYPQPVRGHVNIGLLHTALDGREGHAPYAPCSLHDLFGRNYDYWALGHVHEREIVCEEPVPVVFSGNTQGRHCRETGPRGVTLVDFQGAGAPRLRFVPVHDIEWHLIGVDVSEAATLDDVLERVYGAFKPLAKSPGVVAVRVVLEGSTSLDRRLRGSEERILAELRAVGARLGRDRIWLEKVRIKTSPSRKQGDPEASGPLLRMLGELAKETAWKDILFEDPHIGPLLNEVRAATRSDDVADLDLDEFADTVLAELEQRLLGHRGE